jgi:hypothetical protein
LQRFKKLQEAIAKEASNLAKLTSNSVTSETADALENENPNEDLIHSKFFTEFTCFFYTTSYPM